MKSFVRIDPALEAVPNSANVATPRFVANSLLTEVTYTIDGNGLRITPQATHADLPAILFLGCSLTFGDRLNDQENFPYLVGLASPDRYQVNNFAFPGYGTHQTYARAASSGLRQILAPRKPSFAMSFAIPDHLRRALGQYSWTENQPRYTLDAHGHRWAALLERFHFGSTSRLQYQFKKSYLYVAMLQAISGGKNLPPLTASEI